MLGKCAFTSIFWVCLFAAAQAFAQESLPVTEATPASSPQTSNSAAAGEPSNDEQAINAEIDSLLKSYAGAKPSELPTTNASDAAAGSSKDDASTNAKTDRPLPTSSDPAKDPDPTYAPIPVAIKKDKPDTAQYAAPPQSSQIEEIVVTATKRPEFVRDIPASISVLTGQKLEDMGAHEIKDFIQAVPGLNNQDDILGSNMKLSVRGVGPDNGTNQTVGIVYGDVALSDPYGSYTIADPDPWDLRTVEVLKGPQGTLFGATSLAGIVRYVPNGPQLGSWNGLLSADWVHITQGGTEPSFGAVLNAPIGETIALRFAGSWQHKPGLLDVENPSYQKKNADDGYTRTGRIMAMWQPTEEFTVNAWYTKGQRNSGDLGYLTNPNGQFVRDDTPAPSPIKNGYSLATLDGRYSFDWATLVSISAYQTKSSFNDADASYLVDPLAKLGLRTVHAQRKVDTDGYQQELRLVSPDEGPWTWLTGAYISTYKAEINSVLYVYPGLAALANLLSTLPLSAVASLYDPQLGLIATTTGLHPVKASEKALFGELSRTIGEDWKVTIGGRLYDARVSGTSIKSGAAAVLGGPSSQSVDSLGKGFSPKFSATWHYSDSIMAYGTISRGFQYGGFNIGTLTSVPPTYKSSTLMNYEMGVRTDWFDRTVRVDITGFYDPWKNPQVYQGTQDQIGGYTANVGAALSTGAETTLSYITPIRGLTLETSASYIVANTTVVFNDSSGNTIHPGTALPNSPRVQATTTLSYGYDLGAWHTQTALIHVYQGTAWNNIEHDVQVGGYNMLNLNFAVSRNDQAFSPSLGFQINNLTNVNAITSALGGSGTIPGNPQLSQFITPRPYSSTQPRSFRINLTAKF